LRRVARTRRGGGRLRARLPVPVALLARRAGTVPRSELAAGAARRVLPRAAGGPCGDAARPRPAGRRPALPRGPRPLEHRPGAPARRDRPRGRGPRGRRPPLLVGPPARGDAPEVRVVGAYRPLLPARGLRVVGRAHAPSPAHGPHLSLPPSRLVPPRDRPRAAGR